MCLDIDPNKYINAALIEALEFTTLSDLHDDLLKCHPTLKTEKEAKKKYPKITMDLIMEIIDTADECPVCYKRFLKFGVKHSKSCKLGPLLPDANIFK